MSAKSQATPGSESSPLVLPPSGGLLSRLPGLDSPDANSLMGRNRLSQALELEEKQDNRYLRLSLYALGGIALIFIPWAALTPITQVVNASGEVVPEGDVNVIQHLEGGIVAKVNMADGEKVSKGQVLLELDRNLLDSEKDATEQQLKNLQLQQKQLQAAIRGDRLLPLTPDIKQGDKVDMVSTAQDNLRNSRIDNREDQVASAQAMVDQKQAEVTGLKNQIHHINEQRRMWASLLSSGAAS